MPVLIDGNNLLYAARDAEAEGPLVGRSLLCHRLSEWVRRRREQVHIVFDGPAPPNGVAQQMGRLGIALSFSGGKTADAEVARLLNEDSAARRLLVVSSDREVAAAARRRRAQSMRSEDFWALVKHDLSRPPPVRSEPPEKWRGLSPEDVAAWLDEFGFDSSE